MSTGKPVWTWLPGTPEPVRAGEFKLEEGVGSFSYDPEYRAMPGAIALDPERLPFTRAQRPHRETRQQGLFGVFRDASPEGFGLSLLEAATNQPLHDPIARLEASVGDAVGAIEVCDDIGRKLAYRGPTSTSLLEALAGLSPEQSSTSAARQVMQVQGTSLGGERPKLTVMHDGQMWIAKLQLRGDPPHAPLREFAAMRCARAAGLDVADTEFRRAGEREVMLVRRFDRHVGPHGQVERRHYASAHTVLGLDSGETRGDRSRSYLALAFYLNRWCGRAGVSALPQQRELYRRMVFNAVIGNGDDHPRNHGLLHRDGGWALSPAFDIAPYVMFSGTLAMAVNRAGESAATAAALLADCESFGFTRPEALDLIERCVATVQQQWPEAVKSAGFARDELPALAPDWLQVDEARSTPPRPGRRPRVR